MYRIGDVHFETHEEAEAWAHGNIGGTYSIVPIVFCPDHLDYFDEVWDKLADEFVCAKCYQRRQEDRAAAYRAQLEQAARHEDDLRKLAAWNSGKPITPYVAD